MNGIVDYCWGSSEQDGMSKIRACKTQGEQGKGAIIKLEG